MAAEQGDAEAQVKLAECYEYGKGVEDDEEEAVKWYKKAAKQGDAEAQRWLDYYDEASEENDEAVEQQLSKEDMFTLGEDAFGKADYLEAVKWYKKAAEQGDLQSILRLGSCYLWGYGVEKDVDEAEKWYELAANRGSPEAQNGLARCSIRRINHAFQGIAKESKDILDMWHGLTDGGNDEGW